MYRLAVLLVALLVAVAAGGDAAQAYLKSIKSTAPNEQNADQIKQLSQRTLRGSPLNAAAMRHLGMIAEWTKVGTGTAKFALAETISRRDLPSELRLLQTAARKGDTAAALRHYDHLLSVHPGSKTELFPILASALAEPELRGALASYAARPWLREFVSRAVDHDAAPGPLMALYDDLAGKIPDAELQASLIRMIDWFASNRQSAELGAMVARMPGVGPGALAEFGFTSVTTDIWFGNLAWQPNNDAAISAESLANELTIEVAPEKSGIVATRRTFFAPGSFEVTQAVSFPADAPRARLAWLVSCLGEDQLPVQRIALSPAAPITIPPGCGVQVWQLQASAAVAQIPSRAKVSNLDLRRK